MISGFIAASAGYLTILLEKNIKDSAFLSCVSGPQNK